MHSFFAYTKNNQYQDPVLTEDHNSACKTNKIKKTNSVIATVYAVALPNTIINIIHYKYQGLYKKKKKKKKRNFFLNFLVVLRCLMF